MPEIQVPAEVQALVERIAAAGRGELGAEVDAYPGCRTPEGADPLNRAFRAVVRALLAADGVPANALAATVSRTLLRAATRRLEAEGRDAGSIKSLIEGEPGRPDDWLAFLILADRAQVEPLIDPDGPDLA